MNLFLSLTCCVVALTGGADRPQAADPEKFELRMKPTATVRGAELRIGDFCEVLPIGRAALELAQLEFGRAPTQGFARTIGRNEVLQALAGAGYDAGSIKFEGSPEAIVQAVVVEVPMAEMLDAARTALQAVLDAEGGDVEFEEPTGLRRVQAPPGRQSQEISARVRGSATSVGSAIVDVEILVDGESFRKVPITFKLTRFQPVLRTVGPIRAGTPLGSHNLEQAREAIAQGANLYFQDFLAVDGMVASRDLQSGRRLMLADTAPPAAIKKGETVTVVADSGRVKVSSRAVANHDAPIGARITLTNPVSNRQIVGIVTSPGLVVVK